MLVVKLQCLGCNHIFRYLRFDHEKNEATTCSACTSNNVGHELDIWAAYILTYGPGITMDRVIFSDCGGAIKVQGGIVIRGNDVLLKGNRNGIDADDLYIDVEGLTIE